MYVPRLILASTSPRRQELLREAGYEFLIQPSEVDEADYPAGLTPAELAEYLAARKAEAVAARCPGDVVLGADTVVALQETPIGKPTDADHARRMLTSLGGTIHQCITGIAVIHRSTGFDRRLRVISTVQMRPLTNPEIDEYVASNQWRGKAGGYGIQDPDPFVTRITGSLTNIVGLPLQETIDLLTQAGIPAPSP